MTTSERSLYDLIVHRIRHRDDYNAVFRHLLDCLSKQVWEIPLCVRHDAGTTCGSLEGADGHIDLPGCPTWWMHNENGAGYFRFSMSPADWTRLRTKGFTQLSDRGRMAVADSVQAAFDRGAMDV